MDDLKQQLAKEDAGRQGAGVTFAHEISPSTFLQRALEVEAAQ